LRSPTATARLRLARSRMRPNGTARPRRGRASRPFPLPRTRAACQRLNASTRSDERDQRELTRSDTRSSAGRPTLPESSRSARPVRDAAGVAESASARRSACSRSSRLSTANRSLARRVRSDAPVSSTWASSRAVAALSDSRLADCSTDPMG
jgi:hypothetical protein